MTSLFKGLTGSQRGGNGREDVVHEPDRAVGSLSVHGEGLERPDQVGLALAFVQMVLAYPGMGAVQQLNQGCKRFTLARLTQLQQQLAQIACVRPESTPRQGQQALESLTRESKCIEARGAGSRRRQRAVPGSITDREAGLDQQGLGKAQESAMHSRSVAARSVPLLG